MPHDYTELLWAETADLAGFVSTLDEEQWDASSLCDGWRVRDVVGHMCVGHTVPLRGLLPGVARSRFRVDAASRRASIDFADERSTAELAEAFAAVARDRTMRGVARMVPRHAAFTDHLVHHQDLRRPLGLPRDVPEERLVAALDALRRPMGGAMPARKRTKGLRMVATDVDWADGDGPEVRGPGEALVLAALGRRVALDDLEGDGADLLGQRLAA